MEEVEICIPALNEEGIILSTLAELLRICDSYPHVKWKITVVDNGSSDSTVALVQAHTDTRVFLHRQPKKGKGAALAYGAAQSSSDYFIYLDADLSADVNQLIQFVKQLQLGADVIAGSRLLVGGDVHRSHWRTATSYLFKTYADILVPVPVRDSQCGFKGMNQKGMRILGGCIEQGWFVDREFLAKAHKKNLSIVEVPISWEEFRYPNRKSKLSVLKVSLQSIKNLWYIRKEVQKY